MPVTLEQAKVGMQDKVVPSVIDTFRRGSLLLDTLQFDDAVSPGTGGSTLVYGYTQLKTPSTGSFRNVNEEYVANEAAKEEKTTRLKIFGGAYQIDRVIQSTSGQANEATFQLEQKIKGAANLFHNTVINGDSGTNAKEFDGLNKMLTGSSTEIGTEEVLNLVEITEGFELLDRLDSFLGELDGKPDMLMGNSKLIQKIKSAARRAGYATKTEDGFGRTVTGYDGIPLVDLGYFATVDGGTATTNPIVNIVDRDVAGTPTTGLTDLYAVSVGLDGFHGVTPTGVGGGSGITAYLPDFSTPGAVKTGEVEMVAGVALKATRKAGVLRNIKVQ